MPVFPYALIRLAGLPWSTLSCDLSNLLYHEQRVNSSLEAWQEIKEELISLLIALKASTKDYPLKTKLSTHLVRIRKGKTPKSRTGLAKHLSKTELSVLEDLISEYNLAIDKYDTATVIFEGIFSSAEKKLIEIYLQRMHESSIWSDLALINPGLATRAEQLIPTAWPLNKKKRQSWRTMLKVLTRSVTKTSPFAHFGPVMWVGLSQQETKVNWQLNQWIHQLLRQKLKAAKDFELSYQVTPGLQIDGDEFLFIQNELNKETIHRLGQQPLLDLIIDTLKEKPLSQKELHKILLEQIEVEPDQLMGIIGQLIGLGFLNIDWPVKSDDPYWLNKWLEQLPEHIGAPLHQLELNLKALDTENEEVSLAMLQKQSVELINTIFPNLPKEKTISPQRIFSANVFEKNDHLLPDWSKSLEEPTAVLQEILDFLFPNAERASLDMFYEEHYAGEAPQLLVFHEKYHQAKPFDLKNIYQDAASRQDAFIDYLKSNSQVGEIEIVISLALLQKYIQAKSIKKSHPWRGIIVQQGSADLYLTHCFLGHGKMISRFLNEGAAKIIYAVEEANAHFSALTAEPLDDNFFTVNLHPNLAATKIDWLEHQEEDERITPGEWLVVKKKGELCLWHKPGQQKVVPINYGFESLERRSPLFQTLVGLGPIVTDIAPLRKLLRQAFGETNNYGQHWPRLRLNNGLVLLRAGWEIKPEKLPQLDSKERSLSWLQLRQFQKEIKFPDQVFIKLINKEKAILGDHYKPQYFDFSNPSLLDIWLSVMKQDMESVFVEEVFPVASGRAKEWVIEYR